jgi:copper chaperone CopZ
MKARNVGILSAILGSICCVGPLVLVALGLGTGAALIGRYHWIFIVAAMAILIWAWAKYLREKTVCDCEHTPMERRRTGIVTLLTVTLLVVGFAGLNVNRYVFAKAPLVAQTETDLSNGLHRIVVPVEGLSCVTCEIPVRHALRKIDGVKSVEVSAATKTATIEYEPAKTDPDQLVAAIDATGYRASLPKK